MSTPNAKEGTDQQGGSSQNGGNSEIMGVNWKELSGVKVKDLAIRFLFGALISALADGVSVALGAHIGGIFLGAPAILPATLTLIEKAEGRKRAVLEVSGAVLGAVALVTFALVAALLTGKTTIVLVLLVAMAIWLIVAIGLYLTRAKVHVEWRKQLVEARQSGTSQESS